MVSYTASKALADNLQAKPPKLTPAQHRTMEILLNTGKVYLANNPNGRVDPRSECLRKTADQLSDLGYVRWVATANFIRDGRLGWYVLTDAGKAFGLTLPDKQSSASRQHRLDAGRYLKYGDREEFHPVDHWTVGQRVEHYQAGDIFEIEAARRSRGSGTRWVYDARRILIDGTKGDLFRGVALSPLTYNAYTRSEVEIPTFPTVRRADGLSVRLVQPGDRVEGVVVSTKPGETTVEVISGLYAPGTIVTIKTKEV